MTDGHLKPRSNFHHLDGRDPSGSAAGAFNMFDEADQCTTNNCRSLTINGTVLTETIDPPSILPWVAQAFATAGDCVRFQVTRQEIDLEIVVASPNGQVWVDDDSGGNLRPLVEIADAPVDGWYTVQISQFAGSPSPDGSDFTLKYGRYFGAGVTNCNNPTSPRSSPQSLTTEPDGKSGDGASGRPFDEGSPGR